MTDLDAIAPPQVRCSLDGPLSPRYNGSILVRGEVGVSIKPDHWIRRMALEEGMLEPFEASQVRGEVISYGLGSYGYDIRLAGEFKVPVAGTGVLDPKAIGPDAFEDIQAENLDLAPQTFVLGRTMEYFRIPPNVLTLCTGKSSYARCGVVVNVTPFEPAWEGYATLCIANVGFRPVRLHAGEGIAQVVFFESDEACEVTYADKKGKYQAQQTITPSRLG
jgi:dCTP deaminase